MKKDIYETILPQIRSLVSDETDMIANMANVAALLHESLGFWWTGFYLVKTSADSKQLVLGPFQGPMACTRIDIGKGVCGTAWERKETIVVPDVEQFKGHIACSSESKSEIVVPLIENDEVIAVLDIDSRELSNFDDTDAYYLNKIAKILC